MQAWIEVSWYGYRRTTPPELEYLLQRALKGSPVTANQEHNTKSSAETRPRRKDRAKQSVGGENSAVTVSSVGNTACVTSSRTKADDDATNLPATRTHSFKFKKKEQPTVLESLESPRSEDTCKSSASSSSWQIAYVSAIWWLSLEHQTKNLTNSVFYLSFCMLVSMRKVDGCLRKAHFS